MSIDGEIVQTTAAHKAAIESLLQNVFGVGRLARAAERVREQTPLLESLSYVFVADKKVLASIAYAPIRVGESAGLLLGPLVVSPDGQNQGIGVRIMEHTLALADKLAAFEFVLLVGDLPYYERVGFAVAQNVAMPAPCDPQRLLVRGKTDIAGKVIAAPDLV